MAGVELLISAICLNLTDCINDVTPLPFDESISPSVISNWVNNLNGVHLRIGTIENFPLSYTEIDGNGTIIGRGASFDIIEILREQFNFTYDIVVPKENMEVSRDSTESTLISMLSKGEINMTAAFLPVISDLTHEVIYSNHLDEAEWLIMMKRPTESASGSGLLAPFNAVVWYLILIAVLTFGPFIYIVSWLRYFMTKDETNKPYKLGPCVWFVYGGLIKQGTSLSPEANTTRILFATWWIFITLLSAFYTANLTAFLTLSRFTLSINDPKDIVKKNNKWIARKGGAFEFIVKNPHEELNILNQMVTKNRGMFAASTKDNVFISYVEKDYVFIRDKPAVELLMYEDYKQKTKKNIEEKLRCTFVVTDKPFMKQPRAFAYPKSSKIAKLFDPVILSIVEAGIVKFKTNYELPGNQVCPLNLKSTERRLRNTDLLMTYVLAGIGIAAASIAFCLENQNLQSYARSREKYQNKKEA